MTTWNIKPKVGEGWYMNDTNVTMNSAQYSMNYYFSDTVWQILSSLSTLIIIHNFI